METKLVEKFNISFDEELREIIKIIDVSSQKDEIRQFAVSLLGDFKATSFDFPEAQKIFNWVRDNVRFVEDVAGSEYLQYPEITITNKFGDCDDMVILLATLYRSIGYNVALVFVALTGAQSYNHIYLCVKTNVGYAFADATHKEGGYLGWELPPENWYARKIVCLGTKGDFE